MRKIKSIVATILSLGMVMAGSLTSFAAELPDQNSEGSVSIESAADSRAADVYPKGSYFIEGNGVRLRKSPSLDATVNGLLYENKEDWVTISGVKQKDGDITWCEVTDSSTGCTGWIAQQFLKTPIK